MMDVDVKAILGALKIGLKRQLAGLEIGCTGFEGGHEDRFAGCKGQFAREDLNATIDSVVEPVVGLKESLEREAGDLKVRLGKRPD